jgi:N-terminal domain on NACHT_NTPase and P-loop NTPases/NB-ARC domain
MDPITAIGLASSVVQLVDFGLTYSARIVQFTRKHSIELPVTLQLVQQRLGLVKDSLKRITAHVEANPEEYPTSSLNVLLLFTQSVERRCRKLDEISDNYLPSEDADNVEKVKKALVSIGKDKKINELAEQMTQDVSYIILFQVTMKGHGSNRTSHLDGRFLTNVPQRLVNGFVGQEKLLASVKQHFLEESEDEPRVLILQGMGGLGKTQAALEHCRRMRKDKVYSSILWVDATSKASVIQSFETISEVLKAPNQSFTDSESRILFVKSLLVDWKKNWLLVFDNYDNPGAFRIKDFFPTSQNGNVLVTTRSPELHRIGHMIEVEGMSEHDALSLLFDRIEVSPTSENRQNGLAIVRRLGK